MNEEFATYEQSLALKELGFDEECLAYYTKDFITFDKEGNKTNFVLLSAKSRGELVGHGTCRNYLFNWLKENDRTSGELYTLSNSITAPLKQQIFKWFRGKHNFVGNILGDGFNGELKGYYYSITEEGWINYYESIDQAKWYDTYEEAESACIDKLIEIVTNATNQ